MYELLTSAVSSLINTITVHPGSNFLLKIIVLLMIVFKCKMLSKFSSDITNRFTISFLLQNLIVKDDSTFRIISTEFFVHYQTSILELLDILIVNAVGKFQPPIGEWIYAVPLLHFVMKKCKPFEQLQGTTWDYDYMTKQVQFVLCRIRKI